MRWLLLLVCCMLFPAAGCSQPDLPPLDQWVPLDSLDAPYSILFPKKPKRISRTEAGVLFKLQSCQINRDFGLMAGYSRMPVEFDINDKELVQTFMDSGIRAAIASKNGRIQDELDSLIQEKYPCREVTAAVKLPSGVEGIFRMRVILIPGKYVQVNALGTIKDMQSPRIKEFFDSLQINQ